MPLVPASGVGRNTNTHQNRPRDRKMLELALSLEQALAPQPSEEQSFSTEMAAFYHFIDAMKARSHHRGLSHRVVRFLDSFTIDPADKNTPAQDQVTHQFANNLRSAYELAQRQKEEIDQLRHECEQYRAKASSTDHLVARDRQRNQAFENGSGEQHELQQRLWARNTGLTQHLNYAAPRTLSAEQGIKPNTEWQLPTMQQNGQAPTSYQQPLDTPPSSITTSSPPKKLATIHHQDSAIHRYPKASVAQRRTPTQAIGSMFGVPHVPTNPARMIMNNGAYYGEAHSSAQSAQHDPTPDLHQRNPASSPFKAPYVRYPSFHSEDASRDSATLPTEQNHFSAPDHLDSMSSHVPTQPPWPVNPQQYGQNPTIGSWIKEVATEQQQAPLKRGSECLNDMAPTAESPHPAKKAKKTNTTKKAPAPKKTPVIKKAASKETEPRKKLPRRTKKDKEELEANLWTPSMIKEQEELLGKTMSPAPAPEPAAAAAAGPAPKAAQTPKATETIVIPDDVETIDNDPPGSLRLIEALKAFIKGNSTVATAAGNS
ncbi:MAG: hypothetical protein Q9226_000130 [Calogaya cf. arnoldii]